MEKVFLKLNQIIRANINLLNFPSLKSNRDGFQAIVTITTVIGPPIHLHAAQFSNTPYPSYPPLRGWGELPRSPWKRSI